MRAKSIHQLDQPHSYNIPVIIEQGNKGERSYDIYSRLLKDRIIVLKNAIDEESGGLIIAQLLHLESDDPVKDINLYINSPGGYLYEMFGIYDTIQAIKPKVNTICNGWAASAAAFLLCSGTGRRLALPNSNIMIHQPLGASYGQASDIAIQNTHMQRLKSQMIELMSKHTKQSIDKITVDIERNYWMTPEEAKNYGIIDDIIGPIKR